MTTHRKCISLVLFVVIIAIIYLYLNGRERFKMIPLDYPTTQTVIDSKVNAPIIPCNVQYQPKRWMWQHVPPARNTLQEVRDNPAFIPPVNNYQYGIWLHTPLFGNYRDIRSCSKNKKT